MSYILMSMMIDIFRWKTLLNILLLVDLIDQFKYKYKYEEGIFLHSRNKKL
jgi:hypothetical protein